MLIAAGRKVEHNFIVRSSSVLLVKTRRTLPLRAEFIERSAFLEGLGWTVNLEPGVKGRGLTPVP